MARATTTLIVTVSLSDMEATRLLIWALWQLVHEMRVAGPYTMVYAERLEEALDRYVRAFGPQDDNSSQAEG